MHNPTPIVLSLVMCALASGQTTIADARDRLPTPLEGLERPPAPDLATAWFRLWGDEVAIDETWLLRVTAPVGGECTVQNSQERLGRLRVVTEIPLSNADQHEAIESDLVCDLLQGGFAVFAVGGIIQTPRAQVAVVGLDIRDELGSLIIPWAVVTQAGLVAATQDAKQELHDAGGVAALPGAAPAQASQALDPTPDRSTSAPEVGEAGMTSLTLGGSLSTDWSAAAAADDEGDFRLSTMALGALLLLLGAALAHGGYGVAASRLTTNATWQGWLRRHFGGA